MPSERSARVLVRKSLRNRPLRTATRTYVKKAQETIATGDSEAAVESTNQAIKVLDKAATKGIIHRNNAARRKSRLMDRLNRLNTPQS
ncbi:30S ribosomal protein S20 [SAR202 cluster bacterium AC-647-N09_OGT_505m]|nr:30S ribosomal protein S20 [SAR202 cluster bacterium AC-647-N09_OGT_505m]